MMPRQAPLASLIQPRPATGIIDPHQFGLPLRIGYRQPPSRHPSSGCRTDGFLVELPVPVGRSAHGGRLWHCSKVPLSWSARALRQAGQFRKKPRKTATSCPTIGAPIFASRMRTPWRRRADQAVVCSPSSSLRAGFRDAAAWPAAHPPNEEGSGRAVRGPATNGDRPPMSRPSNGPSSPRSRIPWCNHGGKEDDNHCTACRILPYIACFPAPAHLTEIAPDRSGISSSQSTALPGPSMDNFPASSRQSGTTAR